MGPTAVKFSNLSFHVTISGWRRLWLSSLSYEWWHIHCQNSFIVYVTELSPSLKCVIHCSLEHWRRDVNSSAAPEHAAHLTSLTGYLPSGEESSGADPKQWQKLCGCWGGPFRNTTTLCHPCFCKLPVIRVPLRNSSALVGSPSWTCVDHFFISHCHVIWDLKGLVHVFPEGHSRGVLILIVSLSWLLWPRECRYVWGYGFAPVGIHISLHIHSQFRTKSLRGLLTPWNTIWYPMALKCSWPSRSALTPQLGFDPWIPEQFVFLLPVLFALTFSIFPGFW